MIKPLLFEFICMLTHMLLSQVVKSSFACLTCAQFGPKGKWTSVKIHHFQLFKYSTVLTTFQHLVFFNKSTDAHKDFAYMCVSDRFLREKECGTAMCKTKLIMILRLSIIHQNWFKCVPTKRVVSLVQLRPLFPPTNKFWEKMEKFAVPIIICSWPRTTSFYTLFPEMITCQQFPGCYRLTDFFH